MEALEAASSVGVPYLHLSKPGSQSGMWHVQVTMSWSQSLQLFKNRQVTCFLHWHILRPEHFSLKSSTICDSNCAGNNILISKPPALKSGKLCKLSPQENSPYCSCRKFSLLNQLWMDKVKLSKTISPLSLRQNIKYVFITQCSGASGPSPATNMLENPSWDSLPCCGKHSFTKKWFYLREPVFEEESPNIPDIFLSNISHFPGLTNRTS